MNLIPQALLANYQESLFGRSLLKLFETASGKPHVFPTSRQKVKFFTDLSKVMPSFSGLIADMFASLNFLRLDIADLEQAVDIRKLFEKLRRYPLTEPLFVELMGLDTPVLVWINTMRYEGSPEELLHVIFTAETGFPNGLLGCYDIDLSEQAGNSAITVVKAPNESWSIGFDAVEASNDPFLKIVLGLLRYRVTKYHPAMIPIRQVVENKSSFIAKERHLQPHDPTCADLLKRLFDREINLTLATVALDRIEPFSYESCFDMSLIDLETGLKHLDDACLLVYEKDGKFIASDDYIFYMAMRLRELPFANVAIMGAFTRPGVRITATGGPELLPAILQGEKIVTDDLSAELNAGALNALLVKLRLADSAGEWARIKCVILTEDRHDQMLDTLLVSSGAHPDEITIMSYEGCAQVGSLAIIMKTLKQLKKDLRFVVHRDADYLPKHELEKLAGKIRSQGAVPLITKGTDIESYYLDAAHVHFFYDQLALPEIEQMIAAATQATEKESLTLYRKHKYGIKHTATEALQDLQITTDYYSNVTRYRYGKRTLGHMKAAIQIKIGQNPDLIRPSPFLFDNEMRLLAGELWPNSIVS